MSLLTESLIETDEVKAKEVIHGFLKDGTPPLTLIEEVLAPALEQLGRLWSEGEVALAQIYTSGKICEKIIDELLNESEEIPKKDLQMALVLLEDHHVLGKRIVMSFLKSAGYVVQDYGNMKVDALLEKLDMERPKTLLISTLMLNSAKKVKLIREGLNEKGLSTSIIVGGAPFNLDRELWKDVGADAMASNAGELLRLLKEWPA